MKILCLTSTPSFHRREGSPSARPCASIPDHQRNLDSRNIVEQEVGRQVFLLGQDASRADGFQSLDLTFAHEMNRLARLQGLMGDAFFQMGAVNGIAERLRRLPTKIDSEPHVRHGLDSQGNRSLRIRRCLARECLVPTPQSVNKDNTAVRL